MRRKRKTNKSAIIIAILALITVGALCVTMWALFLREPDDGNKVILTPDYAPQKNEINQKPIEDDSGEKMEAEKGGGAVSLTYSTNVTIDLSDETAILYFANPGKSVQDMVVQIVIQDNIIVQSGKLTPGNQLTALDLLDDTAKKLTVGGYDGKFVILYYDPDTGEKAIVNTEIPITINVVE